MARLTDDMLEFISSGVAHQVGACTAEGRPLICRALAAEQEGDGRVLVLMSSESGFEVLPAIQANQRISLVMVAPQSFRTLHLKGRDATVAPAGPEHGELMDQRQAAFQCQLEPYGYSTAYVPACYSVPTGQLVAIRFTPEGAWNQTPGPGAGHAVALKA
jgi:hypothetical protein